MNPELKQPLISIILPVRNREDFLLDCIDSICQQQYQNWELLIYDDASTDETAGIAKKFQRTDARIHYFYFPSNGATGRIKNEGLRVAQGELICFMDSDDLWPEEKLGVQLSALEDIPEAGFSFTNGYNFSEKDGLIAEYFYSEQSGRRFANFFEEVCSGKTGIRFPTLMIRRSTLKKMPAFKTDRLFTDFSFFTTLAHESSGVLVYTPLLKRRTHDSNVTSEGWNADYEEHTEAIRRYQKCGWLKKTMAEKILFTLQVNWGTHCVAVGKFSKGRKHFMNAWKLTPFSLIPPKKILRSYLR